MIREESWKRVLSEHLRLPYLNTLATKIANESKRTKVYPSPEDTFTA